MKTIAPILSALFGLFLTISLLVAMNLVPPKKERTLSENRVHSVEAPPHPLQNLQSQSPEKSKAHLPHRHCQ